MRADVLGRRMRAYVGRYSNADSAGGRHLATEVGRLKAIPQRQVDQIPAEAPVPDIVNRIIFFVVIVHAPGGSPGDVFGKVNVQGAVRPVVVIIEGPGGRIGI